MTRHRANRKLPRPVLTAACALMAAAGGGCYSYAAPEPPAPTPGQEVRVRLTGQGQDNLRAARALDMRDLDGLWVEGDAREVAVQVRLDANRLGFGSHDFVDTIRVARSDVMEVGVKEVSLSRSILATVVGLGAAYGIYRAFDAGFGSEGGIDDGEQITLIPLSLTRLLAPLGAVFGR